jgi:DNA-binding transcriptional ArsR family regulator
MVPRTTAYLASILGLAPSTVSEHLSVMAASGLLASHREGRRVLYSRT